MGFMHFLGGEWVTILALACILCYYTCIEADDQWTLSESEHQRLKEFFQDSFIQKVRGFRENATQAYCFKDGWHLYHFHHVCTRGGQDGLVTGLTTFDNDWSSKKTDGSKYQDLIMSADDWNSLVIGPTLNMKVRHPTLSIKIEPKEIANVKYIVEPSLFQNCFEQKLNSYNPAHWLMKLGAILEIGLCNIESRESGEVGQDESIFRPRWPLPLDSFYMHQCADPDSTGWEWGKVVYKIVESVLIRAGILRKNYKKLHDPGYQKRGENVDPYEITCFNDIYLSQRNGVWMNRVQDLIMFRKEAARLIGEPKAALESSEVDTGGVLMELPSYCPRDPHTYLKRGSKSLVYREKSNARILIFQRTGTSMLRKFTNLNDVIREVQQFTNFPVEVVTVNSTTSVKDQIKLFNSFDVLITPHGSHLANGIFTMNPVSKGIMEVASFAFDRVFYSNYMNHIGYGQYLISTGHLTPRQERTNGPHCAFLKPSNFKTLKCHKLEHNYPNKIPQVFLECPTAYHTRMCDTHVDVRILTNQLQDLFGKALCHPDLYVKMKQKSGQALDREDKLLEIEDAFSKRDIAEPKVRGVKKWISSGVSQRDMTTSVDKFKDSKYWEDEETDKQTEEINLEKYKTMNAGDDVK